MRTLLAALLAAAPATLLAGEVTANLIDSSAKAREIVIQAKESGASPSTKMKLPELMAPVKSSAKVEPSAAIKRGISPERLRDILAKCPDPIQRDFLKSASFVNGMWVGTPTKDTTEVKRCLGEAEFQRLTRMMASTTRRDSACFFNGECFNKVGWYCNDFDCEYYYNKPGVARENQGCWFDGDCYNLNNHLCNRLNCQGYR